MKKINNTKNLSVIIPVYNADSFLLKSVESALIQSEVSEIILVEDGSIDNSIDVCRNLEIQNSKVRFLCHENGENKGPGISRNLGIANAKGDFLAFLDADDYYLPDRFSKSVKFLLENPHVDGVYEVVGVEYHSVGSKIKHIERMTKLKKNIAKKNLPIDHTGIETHLESDELFDHLLKTDQGWIHLNGLTLRRSALDGFRLFSNRFIGEDSDFIARLACERKLARIDCNEPVAIRGVHDENRITDETKVRSEKNPITWGYWLDYALQVRLKKSTLRFLLMRYCDSSNPYRKSLKILITLLKNPRIAWQLLRN